MNEQKLCPVCGAVMNANTAGKQKNPKAPDWKCSDPNCKYQFNKQTGQWEPGKFITSTWEDKPKQDWVKPEVRQQFQKKVDTDWDKISWGKCKYGFLIELMKNGTPLKEAEPIAEQWADASMRSKANAGMDIPAMPF